LIIIIIIIIIMPIVYHTACSTIVWKRCGIINPDLASIWQRTDSINFRRRKYDLVYYKIMSLHCSTLK